MSWYPIRLEDLDLSGSISVTWTCPRCNKRQSTDFNADWLLSGNEISCQNTEVCGEGQVYFELELCITCE